MKYRYLYPEKINTKSKRKKNQFINEFIKRNYGDLMISKEEFKLRHKEQITEMFNSYGWDITSKMFIEDCLDSHYWYRDPICYKTCLDNLDFLDFDSKFIELFGEEMLKNKLFLKKIKAVNNRCMHN